MYDRTYIFPHTLTPEWKDDLQNKTQDQLSEILGVEVDNVMAEYVLVMVGNKKNLQQIATDLIDFIGDEAAEQFVEWLSTILPTYKPKAIENMSEKTSVPIQEKKVIENKQPSSAGPKRVISLKGISSSNKIEEKSKEQVHKSTVRTLRPTSSSTDTKDILAKRSKRFGVVEKEEENKVESNKRENTVGKRKSSDIPGGRLAKLLGPPVNNNQAKLDGKDNNHSRKKQRNENTNNQSKRKEPSSRQDIDDSDMDGKHESRQQNKRKKPNTPPLPPENGVFERDIQAPFHGYGHPPFGYYPPGPYGPHMMQGAYPPPYGGYPPHHAPHGAPFPHMMHQYGGRSHGGRRDQRFGGRGMGQRSGEIASTAPEAQRSFQNKVWVNPNVAKAAGEQKEGESGSSAIEGSTVVTVTNTSSTTPYSNYTTPYYGGRGNTFRPRFQNKTWVRPDANDDTDNANSQAALNESLPATPPSIQQ